MQIMLVHYQMQHPWKSTCRACRTTFPNQRSYTRLYLLEQNENCNDTTIISPPTPQVLARDLIILMFALSQQPVNYRYPEGAYLSSCSNKSQAGGPGKMTNPDSETIRGARILLIRFAIE